MSIKLELLAPARNKDIGIAAVDCGADAVYIAGPSFGAREAAGNSFEDIAALVEYAHKFNVRIYLTLNTILYDSELEAARKTIIDAYNVGVDAFIIQDLGILKMNLPPVELHASTQCNIRTVSQARFLESLGFKRIILARELSLAQIRDIHDAVDCEIETFIHGALCVSYSGQCYMSQYLAGRSANRGACIQACRSLYDLKDGEGNVILKNKPILSLKDFCLKDYLSRLADAGVCSFKIEGRLKNASYVKNTVRAYREALDEVIKKSGGRYVKSSGGTVRGGFVPNLSATFNRGFTNYFIEGTRGKWNSHDFAKSMGEYVGDVSAIVRENKDEVVFRLKPASGPKIQIVNGDGLCFMNSSDEIMGVRADVVSGNEIMIKSKVRLHPGLAVYRNFNKRFEDELESNVPERTVAVDLSIVSDNEGSCSVRADAADGRSAEDTFTGEAARNNDMARENIIRQLSKKSDCFDFKVKTVDGSLFPFVPLSTLNALRRKLAEKLSCRDNVVENVYSVPFDSIDKNSIILPVRRRYLNCSNRLSEELYKEIGIDPEPAYELSPSKDFELMRTKYCIRNELGLCPKIKKGVHADPLYLYNNGKRLKVEFDCARCEMSISASGNE